MDASVYLEAQVSPEKWLQTMEASMYLGGSARTKWLGATHGCEHAEVRP